MKKYALAILLLGFLLPTTAMAANDQGLYWGVSTGQQFNYNVHLVNYEGGLTTNSTDFAIVVEVTYLATIPDNLDNITDLVLANTTMKFENGTDATPSFGLMLSLLTEDNESFITQVISPIPIGNWTLYDSFTPENITTFDNATHWGYDMSSPGAAIELYYLKTNGMPSYFHLAIGFFGYGSEIWFSMPSSTTSTTTTTTTTTTTGTTSTNGPLTINPIVLLAIGGGALVVIVIVVVWSRSRK